MQSNFADTILNIAITGNLVRIDLGVLTPTQTAEGKLEQHPTPTHQIVMPIEGFVRSFDIQERVITQLIESGVIQKKADKLKKKAGK
jgi:hypothetical protein